MKKYVQDKAPKRTQDAQDWIDENKLEQEKRYAAIVEEMDDLEPEREKWYAEFLTIMQNRGFNSNGDMRRVIAKEDIPQKPDRPNKVVF